LNNLALAQRDLKQLTNAEAIAREALDLRRKVLPQDDPDIGVSLETLGTILLQGNKLPEAEDAYLKAVTLRQARHGNDPDLPYALKNLAAVLAAGKKYAEAAERIREAISVCERTSTNEILKTELSNRLKSYEANSPHRETTK
jgi:tetratricopeptide (TPR) repeat protein